MEKNSENFKGKPTPFEAIVLAYYLARYDKIAVEKLGFVNLRECFQKLGKQFDVPPNTLKNRRDDFDPLFGHRAGWHQYKLGGKLAKVADFFQYTDDEDLHELVIGMVKNEGILKDQAWMDLNSSFKNQNTSKKRGTAEFVPRGITGKKAEKAFEEFHSVSKKPFPGKLLDRRDDGCGYDYELITNNSSKYIEVKGLAGNEGGMSFTAKEWEMAKKHQDDYFVVLVKNVGNEPSFYIYQNPHSNLQPKKHLIQTVQIRWNLSANQI